jgi:hypothetical protein
MGPKSESDPFSKKFKNQNESFFMKGKNYLTLISSLKKKIKFHYAREASKFRWSLYDF